MRANRTLQTRESHESADPESEGRTPAEAGGTSPSSPRKRRHLVLAGVIVVVLLALLVGISYLRDEPLRRSLEGRMNQSLNGYQVRLGHAHLSLLSFTLTLKDLTVLQQENPEPPVASLPELKMSVHWKELLRLRVVADVRFDRPRIHIDRSQLIAETEDAVPVKERGWQRALESIYPLKINELTIEEGDVTYLDGKDQQPLHITHLKVLATNIRNIRSKDSTYPSPIEATAVLQETGQATVRGHADFLAEPVPGFNVLFDLKTVPLEPFSPLLERSNLAVKGGVLQTSGEAEIAAGKKRVHVKELVIANVALDYIHTAKTVSQEKKAVATVKQASKDAARSPEMDLRLDVLRVTESSLAMVNRSKTPPYRVSLTGMDLTASNFSNGLRQGPATAKLTGSFMGSGKTEVSATFRPDGKSPDFDLKVSIGDTDMRKMNDLLRAYGKFDVVSGTFSFFSEVTVRDRRISGYVKPLFRDLDVLDSRQDEDKSIFRKAYEGLVDGIARLLENSERNEVATKASLEGSIDDPESSTWEVVVRLIQNAFFKAILPGFDRELAGMGKRWAKKTASTEESAR